MKYFTKTIILIACFYQTAHAGLDRQQQQVFLRLIPQLCPYLSLQDLVAWRMTHPQIKKIADNSVLLKKHGTGLSIIGKKAFLQKDEVVFMNLAQLVEHFHKERPGYIAEYNPSYNQDHFEKAQNCLRPELYLQLQMAKTWDCLLRYSENNSCRLPLDTIVLDHEDFQDYLEEQGSLCTTDDELALHGATVYMMMRQFHLIFSISSLGAGHDHLMKTFQGKMDDFFTATSTNLDTCHDTSMWGQFTKDLYLSTSINLSKETSDLYWENLVPWFKEHLEKTLCRWESYGMSENLRMQIIAYNKKSPLLCANELRLVSQMYTLHAMLYILSARVDIIDTFYQITKEDLQNQGFKKSPPFCCTDHLTALITEHIEDKVQKQCCPLHDDFVNLTHKNTYLEQRRGLTLMWLYPVLYSYHLGLKDCIPEGK